MSTADLPVPPASVEDVAPDARGRRFARLNATTVIGAIGLIIVAALVLVAIFAPALAPYDPTERVGRPFATPSAEHPLGTNDIGQDLLSELIYGTRVSLTVGLVAATVALLIGTTVGIIAGFYPRLLGSVLMRIVDIVLILPFLPLLIILAAYLGRSLLNTVLVIGILIWAGSARVIRSQVLSLTQRDYVVAARAMGARDLHIIVKHILPLTLLLAIGEFVQATAGAILLEASLSFLGLGDPLQKSWGSILYWAQVRGAFLTPAWQWWVLPPGLMIMAAALGFALIGFALEQRVNPRLRQAR
jgi:peptide/nickel transport system ATP-binding protein/peptide/nickel transport system permease protein